MGMNHYAPMIAPMAPMFQQATNHHDMMNIPQSMQFPQPNSSFSYRPIPAQQPIQDPRKPKLPRAASSQQHLGQTNEPRRPTLTPVSNTRHGGTATSGPGRLGNTKRQTNLAPVLPCLAQNQPGLHPTKRDDPLREASKNLMKHLAHLDNGLARQSTRIEELQIHLAKSEKSTREYQQKMEEKTDKMLKLQAAADGNQDRPCCSMARQRLEMNAGSFQDAGSVPKLGEETQETTNKTVKNSSLAPRVRKVRPTKIGSKRKRGGGATASAMVTRSRAKNRG